MFPDFWKKSNICPIHKKGNKQIIIDQSLYCQFVEKYMKYIHSFLNLNQWVFLGITFSRKMTKSSHPQISFINVLFLVQVFKSI